MDRIADYEFVRSLGPGHYGECFLARTPERLPVDAEYVAVKVFGSTGPEAFRRATRELQAVAAVRSPYLAAMYDAGQQAGTFYYSMEYLPAGSLHAPAIALDQRAEYVALAQAARALQALHDAGIAHRDVRPGNVMLTTEGTGADARPSGGKLSDFGLAQVLSPGVAVPGSGSSRSIQFVDPAVLNGDHPGPAADLWSLGATLHWAAAGTGLYGELPADDPLATLREVLAATPTAVSGLGPDVADLVQACIGDPAGRPTAAEVAARLEAMTA